MSVTSFPLQAQLPEASRLVLGCMGLGGGWNDAPLNEAAVAQAHAVVEAALAAGITLFDHADIYQFGKAEQAFGALFKATPSLRDRLLLQSKCGIHLGRPDAPQRYELSAAWIERSVEASLQRLHTDRLDLFLLHRPDPLMEPTEIADAFGRLHRAGKVRCFGVSNMHGAQVAWLQRDLALPLVVNQLAMSLLQLDWLEAGTTFNDAEQQAGGAWVGTLEQAREAGVQLQAWGALAQGRWQSHAVAPVVYAVAARWEVPPEAVLIAFLLRHPAQIQPVIGSSHPARIAASAQGLNLRLSREDWYALYTAARGRPLP